MDYLIRYRLAQEIIGYCHSNYASELKLRHVRFASKVRVRNSILAADMTKDVETAKPMQASQLLVLKYMLILAREDQDN